MREHELQDRTFLRQATATSAMNRGPRYSSASGDALPGHIRDCPWALRRGHRRAVIDPARYRASWIARFSEQRLGAVWTIAAGTGPRVGLRQRQDSRHCGCQPANEPGRYDAS
jgi:hypothetical protein